ncbi:MAG TPA: GTPase HflX [Candidatus Polarisedimenticolia bacterium]|nr:GTPase HflX [Candidatus Polarisedimenticolia bacterium]
MNVQPEFRLGTSRQRVILAGVRGPRQTPDEIQEHLEELSRLTETAGGTVSGVFVQERQRRDPARVLGRGKIEEMARAVESLRAGLVIFDEDLSPAQARNLERDLGVPVLDRAGLILDIFALRARSREARVQVELAQLRYLLPRLTRRWTHLERQAGGIGVRGVGETQLETDRRLIQKRIAHLESKLGRIEQERGQRRKRRSEAPQVALVGYTNAGKSTLLNRLTGAGAFVEDRLFATLDPLVRQGSDGFSRFLFIDTVGFIRKLPPQLVASFRSTLEEAREADVLLHVVDASDASLEDHMKTTRQILAEMKLDDKPVITVFNKADRLAAESDRLALLRIEPSAVLVSAVEGRGMEVLRRVLEEAAAEETVMGQAAVDPAAGSAIARIHAIADVLGSAMVDGKLVIRYRARRKDAASLGRLIQEAGGS